MAKLIINRTITETVVFDLPDYDEETVRRMGLDEVGAYVGAADLLERTSDIKHEELNWHEVVPDL